MTEEPTQDAQEGVNQTERLEDTVTRLARELTQARAQRDAVGQLLHHWVGRYFALKAAHGDIPFAAVVPAAERELAQAQETVNAVPAQ